MKKIIKCLFLVLLLSGCNKNKVVSLNLDNYSDYIALNSNYISTDTERRGFYFTYFIGADNCIFKDCVITYHYAHKSTTEFTENSVKLTISGDGQAEPYYIYTPENYPYYIIITNVSGTVEVIK